MYTSCPNPITANPSSDMAVSPQPSCPLLPAPWPGPHRAHTPGDGGDSTEIAGTAPHTSSFWNRWFLVARGSHGGGRSARTVQSPCFQHTCSHPIGQAQHGGMGKRRVCRAGRGHGRGAGRGAGREERGQTVQSAPGPRLDFFTMPVSAGVTIHCCVCTSLSPFIFFFLDSSSSNINLTQ